jgi:hypothetical protein
VALNATNERGERYVWLDHTVVARRPRREMLRNRPFATHLPSGHAIPCRRSAN